MTTAAKKKGRKKRRPREGDGKPGPKTLCTPAMVRQLAGNIERGMSLEAACGAEGISDGTLRHWRAKAEEGVEPYASILAPLKRSMAGAVGQAETRVFAGRMGWQASARWLESMKPDIWRRTERREVNETRDIRVYWADLAKPGKSMAEKRAAAVDEALRKAGKS